MRQIFRTAIAATAALLANNAAMAKDAPAELVRCTENLGTIAEVEGDTQGWLKYNLGSPRELLAAMAIESGCFALHNAASGEPATYLMNVIAGDAEEVDKGMEMAKVAAVEGLVRSGAAGQLLGRVPMGGAVLGMLGGLGGKKKAVAAGIRVISPSNGATLVSGSGTVKKSTLMFGGAGGWAQGAATSGYGSSKDGQMLTEAFIMAFNAVAGQQSVLAARPAALPSVLAGAIVAVDTAMLAAPAADAISLRALRAGTTLTPTGNREWLFVEVSDNFGTKGWVSVENLK